MVIDVSDIGGSVGFFKIPADLVKWLALKV
jgi:hypothetical protein